MWYYQLNKSILLSFLKGAYPGDSVVIIGQLVYVGRTSMDIKVDSYVESMDGTRTLINHAYLTVVALNQNDHPIPVPRLEPTTEDEAAEWEEAKRRRELRKSL